MRREGLMSENIYQFPGSKLFERLDRQVDAMSRDALKNGDGDGTSGGMEGRIARLESDMGHVKDSLKSLDARTEGLRKDVGDIRTDLATLKVKVDHLPGKGFIFAVATGMLGAAGVLMAAVVRFIPHAAG
jgi:hypothetical protein